MKEEEHPTGPFRRAVADVGQERRGVVSTRANPREKSISQGERLCPVFPYSDGGISLPRIVTAR